MNTSTKRLYRSRNDRIVGGVAGGLGDYFNFDPTLVRILFVLLTFFGGSGPIIYLVLWLVVPREGGASEVGAEMKAAAGEIKSRIKKMESGWEDNGGEERRNLLAIVLIILGILVLFNQLPSWIWIRQFFWPVILIGGGLYLIFKK